MLLLPKRFGAEGRTRTGTIVTYRRILSPVRLPIPPPRHNLDRMIGTVPIIAPFLFLCNSFSSSIIKIRKAPQNMRYFIY
jgi:hypothetical protein